MASFPTRRQLFSSLALAVFSIAGTATSTPVQAGLVDSFLQYKTFPQCDDTKVLGKIVKRFNWAEENTWHRGFYMEDITRPRERLEQGTRVSQIPRRYCRAHTHLTNGSHPTVFYLIEGGQGFAGNGFNVRFCVNGLDPWNENDGSCRLLRY